MVLREIHVKSAVVLLNVILIHSLVCLNALYSASISPNTSSRASERWCLCIRVAFPVHIFSKMAQRSEHRSHSTIHSLPSLSPDSQFTEKAQTRICNFYQLLHLSLGHGPVTLRIAETLCVSEEGRDVVLYAEDTGLVQVCEGVEVWGRFLEVCRHSLTRTSEGSQFPLFLFLTATSPPKALFSVAEARKMWTQSKDHTKRIQRFLVPQSSDKICKIRVIWTQSETKYFCISKLHTPDLSTSREVKRPAKSPTFTYASKLNRSSFSPYLPYKSTLSPVTRSVAESVTPAKPSESQFYVSTRTDTDLTTERLYVNIPIVEGVLDTLKRVISPLTVREDETLAEMGYDLQQDVSGNVYVLDVKWVKTLQIAAIQPEIEEESSLKDVRRRFNHLLSSETAAKTPFIDMHDIQENNVKMYLQQFATLPSPPRAANPESSSGEIEEAGNKLDSLLQAAFLNRVKAEEDQKVKLESYNKENFLDYIISKVYAKVTSDPDLQDYFHHMDQREISMIKFGFSKAFTGVDNYYFKRTVKKVHEGLGITAAHFERFIELFLACLLEEGVRSEDVEIVNRHLTRFVDEVVEDDTPKSTSP